MRIQLFGPPAILAGDRRLEHPARKAMALLAYLATRADEHISRSHLAALLWGGSGEEQARANLRQTLSQLRRLFREAGHDPVMVPFDQVVLRSEGIEIDARALMNGTESRDPAALASLPGFLEGFSVPAPEFESWMTAQRALIRSRIVALLEAAAEDALKAGRHAAAAQSLSQALAIDPLQEALHRSLIKALAAQGRTDAALAQYEQCERVLASELQIAPDASTRRLAAEIRARRLHAEPPAEAAAEFNRYPAPQPALVFSDDAQQAPRRFPDAGTALHEALETRRSGAEPVGLAVVPDTGQASRDRAAATTLMQGAGPRSIAVDARIYEQFRHWSPYAFEPAGADGYRLAGEMPRHRLQVMPSNALPETEPLSEFSVAVLPLKDRSPNAAEFALGDVLSEEITHRLSRFGSLTVAAPSAGQAFRAQGLPVGEARARLGVSYLVDGSLFRAGEQLRVSLTLTDLRTGALVLSDHFDGDFALIFAHQDDLIDRIATSLFRNAEKAEVQRAERAPTHDIGAFEWYLRGLAAHRRAGISPDNARAAFGHFTRAIDIDPDFARALAWRICSVGWFAPEYFVDPGLKEIHRALSIDEHDAEVQRIAGALHLYRGDYDDGIRHIERAVELNPSDAYLLASSAVYWAYNGEPQNGLPHIERAMKLDPFLPVWCVEDHGVVLYTMEAYADAIDSLRRLSFPTPRALSFLAASQIAAGDPQGARASVGKIRHIAPDYSVDELMTTNYYRRAAEKAALRKRLHRAGLA